MEVNLFEGQDFKCFDETQALMQASEKAAVLEKQKTDWAEQPKHCQVSGQTDKFIIPDLLPDDVEPQLLDDGIPVTVIKAEDVETNLGIQNAVPASVIVLARVKCELSETSTSVNEKNTPMEPQLLDDGIPVTVIKAEDDLTNLGVQNAVPASVIDLSRVKCEPSETSTRVIENNTPDVSNRRNEKRKGQTEKLYKCSMCSYRGSKLSHLKTHTTVVHENKKFGCKECDYKSSKQAYVISHVNSVHKKIRQYKCAECDYSALIKPSLKDHILSVHLNERNFACKFCDYKAGRGGTLRKHISAVHKQIKRHQCPYCDHRSHKRAAMRLHICAIHEKKEKYTCDKCNYTTFYQQKFQTHLNIHTKEKTYYCLQCHYKAWSQHAIRRHTREDHLGVKRYIIIKHVEGVHLDIKKNE